MSRPVHGLGPSALLAVLLVASGFGCARKVDRETTSAPPPGSQATAPADTLGSGTPTPGTATSGGTVPDASSGALPGTMPVQPSVPPAHIEVQHILIGFAGSVPGKGITRTQEEARKLAYEILARARRGEDFDQLVRQHTDDAPPGIYRLGNTGVTPVSGEYRREQMVPAFGNVGFSLSPGNIGIADYDPRTSPYGWHIIKRLR